MTDEEIYEALGMQHASEDSKQAFMHNFNVVVELRAMSALAELITEEEMDTLEKMEEEGASKDDMLWWLGENVVSAHEVINTLRADRVEELKAKLPGASA